MRHDMEARLQMTDETAKENHTAHTFFGSKPKGLERMNSALTRPAHFLWERNLCKRCVHVIAGAADSGKTKVAAWFASTISAGNKMWPDQSFAATGMVVVCTRSEIARNSFDLQLRALHSNEDNVRFFIIEGAEFEDNLETLGSSLEQLGQPITLVIFDGIPRVDRRIEERIGGRLAKFSQDHDCAILITTTINEKLASTPQSVVGNLTLCNIASVVFVISKISFSEEQDDESVSGLIRVKSTLGPRDEGFGFEIVTVHARVNNGSTPVAVLEWNGKHIYGPLARQKAIQIAPKRHTQRRRAAEFLRHTLMGGAMTSDAVIRLGGQVQIPEDTLRRAATDIGVIRQSQPAMRGGRGPDIWSLPSPDRLHDPNQIHSNSAAHAYAPVTPMAPRFDYWATAAYLYGHRPPPPPPASAPKPLSDYHPSSAWLANTEVPSGRFAAVQQQAANVAEVRRLWQSSNTVAPPAQIANSFVGTRPSASTPRHPPQSRSSPPESVPPTAGANGGTEKKLDVKAHLRQYARTALDDLNDGRI